MALPLEVEIVYPASRWTVLAAGAVELCDLLAKPSLEAATRSLEGGARAAGHLEGVAPGRVRLGARNGGVPFFLSEWPPQRCLCGATLSLVCIDR